jgi:hypothetical protein
MPEMPPELGTGAVGPRDSAGPFPRATIIFAAVASPIAGYVWGRMTRTRSERLPEKFEDRARTDVVSVPKPSPGG